VSVLFEWDAAKAAINLRKHGVSFDQATGVFRDAFAIVSIDTREAYGEDRFNMFGMCNGVILHVTYTERGEHIRIISARRATKHERDDYYRQNAP
jgi:uncharacterized protein